MKVSKRGKGLAVRLPAAVVKVLDLKQGDEIDIHIKGLHQLEISRSLGSQINLKSQRTGDISGSPDSEMEEK